jgi:prevent-host-death family protein
MGWPQQDAKSRFGAVVEAAPGQGPLTVTRRGRPAVTVIAAAEREELRRAAAAARPDVRADLLAIPPADADTQDDVPHARAAPRAVDPS